MTRQTMYRTNSTIPRQASSFRRPVKVIKKHRHKLRVTILLAVIVLLAGGAYFKFQPNKSDIPKIVAVHKITTKTSTVSSPVQAITLPNPCADNTLAKLALVSITQRHMWACEKTSVVYGSNVVTGMENLAADRTPTGTYHVYAKETNLYLNGSDSTGSWHDYVYYWMPFLQNQYGSYGFHDATWRPDNAFGNISPYSSNASHGCVELPLATAKWLFNWVSIGTTVTIEA